jgi:hypothetical protein
MLWRAKPSMTALAVVDRRESGKAGMGVAGGADVVTTGMGVAGGADVVTTGTTHPTPTPGHLGRAAGEPGDRPAGHRLGPGWARHPHPGRWDCRGELAGTPSGLAEPGRAGRGGAPQPQRPSAAAQSADRHSVPVAGRRARPGRVRAGGAVAAGVSGLSGPAQPGRHRLPRTWPGRAAQGRKRRAHHPAARPRWAGPGRGCRRHLAPAADQPGGADHRALQQGHRSPGGTRR